MSLSEWVDENLRRLGWSQAELIRQSGISKATIQKIMGGYANPERFTISRLEKAFGARYSESEPEPIGRKYEPLNELGNDGGSAMSSFFNAPGAGHSPIGEIPLLGTARAGRPGEVTWDGTTAGGFSRDFLRGVKDPSAFAIMLDGDSMSPLFRDGDCVILSPAIDITHEELLKGVVAFVQFTHDRNAAGTVKLIALDPSDPDVFILTANNPAFVPQVERVPREHVARIVPVAAHVRLGPF